MLEHKVGTEFARGARKIVKTLIYQNQVNAATESKTGASVVRGVKTPWRAFQISDKLEERAERIFNIGRWNTGEAIAKTRWSLGFLGRREKKRTTPGKTKNSIATLEPYTGTSVAWYGKFELDERSRSPAAETQESAEIIVKSQYPGVQKNEQEKNKKNQQQTRHPR